MVKKTIADSKWSKYEYYVKWWQRWHFKYMKVPLLNNNIIIEIKKNNKIIKLQHEANGDGISLPTTEQLTILPSDLEPLKNDLDLHMWPWHTKSSYVRNYLAESSGYHADWRTHTHIHTPNASHIHVFMIISQIWNIREASDRTKLIYLLILTFDFCLTVPVLFNWPTFTLS